MNGKLHMNIPRFLLKALLSALILAACGAKTTNMMPTEETVTIVESTAISPLVPTPSNTSALYPSHLPLITKTDILSVNQLAFTYGFSVFILDQNKDGFEKLNPQGFGELRSIAWSPDGATLAMIGIGGTTSIVPNIYMVDVNGKDFHPLISEPMPYLMETAWSHDGERLISWGPSENNTLYLVNKDGSGLTKIELDMQVFGKPQFAPDDASLYFFGAGETSGLFQVGLDGSSIRNVNDQIENTEAFAWSPDGSQLAYVEVDREQKETRLIIENIVSSEKITASTFQFTELNGNGNTLSLEWTPDGRYILFDIELGFDNYVIIAANTDGSGTKKLFESARIPSISPDGKWLAYMGIKEKAPPQLLLADLISALASSEAINPIVVADLPAKRNGSEELDEIRWKP